MTPLFSDTLIHYRKMHEENSSFVNSFIIFFKSKWVNFWQKRRLIITHQKILSWIKIKYCVKEIHPFSKICISLKENETLNWQMMILLFFGNNKQKNVICWSQKLPGQGEFAKILCHSKHGCRLGSTYSDSKVTHPLFLSLLRVRFGHFSYCARTRAQNENI